MDFRKVSTTLSLTFIAASEASFIIASAIVRVSTIVRVSVIVIGSVTVSLEPSIFF